MNVLKNRLGETRLVWVMLINVAIVSVAVCLWLAWCAWLISL